MVPWVADPTRVAVLTLSAEWLSRMGPTSPVRIGGLSLFCNQCGGKIADGSVFCDLCGAKQVVVVPAQAPQPGIRQGGASMGQPYNPSAWDQAAGSLPMTQKFRC